MHVIHEVPLIPQSTRVSCWAACIAMILSWRRRALVDPAVIGQGNPIPATHVQIGMGQQASDIMMYRAIGLTPAATAEILRHWGLMVDLGRTLQPAGVAALLRRHGPLWVSTVIGDRLSSHVVVVAGISGDGGADTTDVFVNDPWEREMTDFSERNRGTARQESYAAFEHRLRRGAWMDRVRLGAVQEVYLAYLP